MSEVEQLRVRAESADKIVADLRNKISDIKEAYVKQASVDLEERLIEENADLKAQIVELKRQLRIVHVRNGVKQIPLPTSVPAAQPEPAVPEPKVPAPKAAAPGPAPAPETGDSSTKKDKKPKKKEGGGGAGKPPAGGDDKPIDVSRLDIRVGLIENVEKHPDADTLYVETVNFGPDLPTRTILSGLVKIVPIEQMRNKKALFIINLKPQKMRGITSEGMILCAHVAGRGEEIIHIPQDSEPGTRMVVNEYPGEPDALLAPKKKIWEQVSPDLKIDGDGIACYKGAPFRLYGETVCKAPTLTNAIIK